MKTISMTASLIMLISCQHTVAQSTKTERSFDEPIVTDSLSTLFIPYRYDAGLLASDKKMAWGDYYANFIVYDFKMDTYKTLFPKDTYITAFTHQDFEHDSRPSRKNISKNWIFYNVKHKDYNGNGKIDEKDPFILFGSDRQGGKLKQLTPEGENVISIRFYESLGFVLLKIQRDENHDREFQYNDHDYYLMKVNLADLSLGNKIEVGGEH